MGLLFFEDFPTNGRRYNNCNIADKTLYNQSISETSMVVFVINKQTKSPWPLHKGKNYPNPCRIFRVNILVDWKKTWQKNNFIGVSEVMR